VLPRRSTPPPAPAVIGLGRLPTSKPAARRAGVAAERHGAASSSASPPTTSSGSRPRSARSTSRRAARSLLSRAGCARRPEVLEAAGGLAAASRDRTAWRRPYEALRRAGRRSGDSRLGSFETSLLHRRDPRVYDPALGHVLGGGGRYDDLMGRFGGPCPQRASRSIWSGATVAQAEEERWAPMARKARTRRSRKQGTVGVQGASDSGPRRRRRRGPAAARGVPRRLAVSKATLALLDRIDASDRRAPQRHSRLSSCFEAAIWCLVTDAPWPTPPNLRPRPRGAAAGSNR
jgi:hypothetical protein